MCADVITVEKLHSEKYYRPGGATYFSDNYECSFEEDVMVGSGGFGQVYQGVKILEDGQRETVILKQVKEEAVKKSVQDEASKKRNLAIPVEFELLARSQHVPGVVKLLEFFFVNGRWILVMKYKGPEHMDLFDHISHSQYLREPEVSHILYQLLNILCGLHSAGVLHRDLKDENILIHPGTKEITLIDFGSGTFLTNEPYNDFEGTRVYSPPEWIIGRSYDGKQAEIWSLGILMFDMLMGNIPFATDGDVVRAKLSIPRVLSSECISLLSSCLKRDARERPSLSQMLQHPFFREYSGNKTGHRNSIDETRCLPKPPSSVTTHAICSSSSSCSQNFQVPELQMVCLDLKQSSTAVGSQCYNSPSGGSSTMSGETAVVSTPYGNLGLVRLLSTSCQIHHEKYTGVEAYNVNS